MAWTLPWPRKALASAGPELHDEDAWSRHVTTLAAHGIPEPGTVADDRLHRPATEADQQALYGVAPSFADLLPWVEYLPGSKIMLLEDGHCLRDHALAACRLQPSGQRNGLPKLAPTTRAA